MWLWGILACSGEGPALRESLEEERAARRALEERVSALETLLALQADLGAAEPPREPPPEPAAPVDGVQAVADLEVAITPERWSELWSVSAGHRVIPHRGPEGAPDGLRVVAIRGGSLADLALWRNGDVLRAMDGTPISLEDPYRAVSGLGPGTHRLELSRRGEPLTLTYRVGSVDPAP